MEEKKKEKLSTFDFIYFAILGIAILWILWISGGLNAHGQEIPYEQQYQQLTGDPMLDLNYIPINKLFEKIKLKDKDTAEAYTIIYGKLENIQRKCGKN